MCGFVGVWESKASEVRRASHRIDAMSRQIAHRGPDSEGAWFDSNAGIGIGFRRLAILDLSSKGSQPMSSSSGRFIVSFNGEIYNYREIRRTLESKGCAFATETDTEVLCYALEAYGIRRAIDMLNGMFAIMVWDRADYCLYLARDHFGIKPLFYAADGERILSASSLDSLLAHPAFTRQVSERGVDAILHHGYDPTTRTIYVGAHEIAPGTIAHFAAATAREPQSSRYWSVEEEALKGSQQAFDGTDADALGELSRRAVRAVSRQMRADVPVGILLSGGIDSTAVAVAAALATKVSLKTFTLAANSPQYDESAAAQQIASCLGSDHTEVYFSPDDLLQAVDQLSRVYDQPLGDVSQVPTLLVARRVRGSVKVCLSGDGGDELFGGYNRYSWAPPLLRGASMAPRPLRAAMSRWVQGVPTSRWDAIASTAFRFKGTAPRLFGEKAHKVARAMSRPDPMESYSELLSTSSLPSPSSAREIWASYGTTRIPDGHQAIEELGMRRFMMVSDAMGYLPNDILAKVDRATMSVSLEARVPLLDLDIARFSWLLPHSMLFRRGRGKWLLREFIAQYIPRKIMDQPKTGFGLPIGALLKTTLHEWAADLLSPASVSRVGILSPQDVEARWHSLQSGQGYWQHYIWSALQIQAWALTRDIRGHLVGASEG